MQTIVDTYIKEYSFEKIDQDIDKAFKHTEDTCALLKKHFPNEVDKIDEFICHLKDQIFLIKDFDNAKFEYVDCGVKHTNKVWIKNKNNIYTCKSEYKNMFEAFQFLYKFLKDSPTNRDIINNDDWESDSRIPFIDINEDEIPF